MLLLAALLAAAWLTHGRAWRLPDALDPWAPLGYDEPPNWLTRHKLERLVGDPAACRAWIAGATPWQAEPLPDRVTGPGCGFTDVLRLQGTPQLRLASPLPLTCRAAVSLALWERHALQPLAAAHLGSPVRRIDHLGSYACRDIAGRSDGRRSEHATANAIDIAGFVLADGRRIGVLRDWPGDDAESRFLRAVHAGACDWFAGVIGPDRDAAHRDHFHYDGGRWRYCR